MQILKFCKFFRQVNKRNFRKTKLLLSVSENDTSTPNSKVNARFDDRRMK